MDVIATDHAPHSEEEKRRSFTAAPFGIVGLETAVPLTISELVEKEYLTPMQMAEKMSYNPAKILGLDKGSLAEGKIADLVIIDPNEELSLIHILQAYLLLQMYSPAPLTDPRSEVPLPPKLHSGHAAG